MNQPMDNTLDLKTAFGNLSFVTPRQTSNGQFNQTTSDSGLSYIYIILISHSCANIKWTCSSAKSYSAFHLQSLLDKHQVDSSAESHLVFHPQLHLYQNIILENKQTQRESRPIPGISSESTLVPLFSMVVDTSPTSAPA